MGLALQDPASSLSDLTELRHLPPGPAFTKADKSKISKNRYHSWVDRYNLQLGRDGETASGWNTHFYHRRELKPHQIAVLASARRKAFAFAESRSGGKVETRTRRQWAGETDEGRDLARSPVRLPSDADRARRPPSLERQEAFRDAATTRKRQRTLDADDFDVDTAELYRLGLLYDDEHERGSGFGLDTIVHDEPVYKLHVRHAKRGRKGKAFDHDAAPVASALPLDLSFAALRDDDALAQFLISPDAEELVSAVSAPRPSRRTTTHSRTPLITVIYELDDEDNVVDGSARSFNVPCENDFPDLVSDDDDENEDWALLKDENTNERDEEENGNAAPGNPDAWIVLG